MLAPDVRRVAVDLLRPPAGYRLDLAVLTTYSLDLETLLALPLAVLAHADEGLDVLLANRLLLAEALRSAGERIHVFVDHSALAIPQEGRALYALLERSVHPVKAPRGGAFHPKVWVARFVAPDGGVRVRVAVGSRNLTFDRSWDVALVSEGRPAGRRNAVSRPLADLLLGLGDMARLPVPPEVLASVESLADEARRTRFPSPHGFDDPVRFTTLGLKGRRGFWTPRSDGTRLLAVSPFVRKTALEHLARIPRGRRTLVARQEELDAIPPEALDGWDVRVLVDEALDDAEDLSANRPSGLHAKLVAIEHGHKVSWWLGSANLTHAAYRSRNVEVMAEISGGKGPKTGNGIDRFFDAGFGGLCEPYVRSPDLAEASTEERDADGALRRAAESLVEAPLEILCAPKDSRWTWQLVGDAPALPDGVVLDVWPVTVKEERARALRIADPWVLPLARLTCFAAFRLRVPGVAVDDVRFVRKLPTRGLPEGRMANILRDLVNSPQRLLEFLRALLGGLETAPIHTTAGDAAAAAGGWAAGLGGDTLLEDLVRAASRDPERLEPVRRLLRDLSATEDGRAIIPDDLLQAWEAVEGALEGEAT